MSMRSTFRGASAAFAAALVLASCGATGGEVSTPTETPTRNGEAEPHPDPLGRRERQAECGAERERGCERNAERELEPNRVFRF